MHPSNTPTHCRGGAPDFGITPEHLAELEALRAESTGPSGRWIITLPRGGLVRLGMARAPELRSLTWYCDRWNANAWGATPRDAYVNYLRTSADRFRQQIKIYEESAAEIAAELARIGAEVTP